MSARYTHEPCEHGPTAMSSQSLTVAPVSRTRPLRAPWRSSAKITGAPESLCAQNTSGVRRLDATPLASGRSRSRTVCPAARQLDCSLTGAFCAQPRVAVNAMKAVRPRSALNTWNHLLHDVPMSPPELSCLQLRQHSREML